MLCTEVEDSEPEYNTLYGIERSSRSDLENCKNISCFVLVSVIMKFMWDLPLAKHQKETDLVFSLLKVRRVHQGRVNAGKYPCV